MLSKEKIACLSGPHRTPHLRWILLDGKEHFILARFCLKVVKMFELNSILEHVKQESIKFFEVSALFDTITEQKEIRLRTDHILVDSLSCDEALLNFQEVS